MDSIRNKNAGIVEIEIPKDFSVDKVSQFREDVYRLMDEGKKDFIMDFKHCEFIDSTGLGVLVGLYKKCMEKRGTLKLYGIRGNVKRVFQLTRLDKVFEICE